MLIMRSLQNFAHAMTPVLWCHVQIFYWYQRFRNGIKAKDSTIFMGDWGPRFVSCNKTHCGDNFAGNLFECIFFHEMFVPMGPIDNNSALVQVMVWC